MNKKTESLTADFRAALPAGREIINQTFLHLFLSLKLMILTSLKRSLLLKLEQAGNAFYFKAC